MQLCNYPSNEQIIFPPEQQHPRWHLDNLLKRLKVDLCHLFESLESPQYRGTQKDLREGPC